MFLFYELIAPFTPSKNPLYSQSSACSGQNGFRTVSFALKIAACAGIDYLCTSAWLRHQSRQTPHEFRRTQDYMRSPVVIERLQGDDDITVVGQRQALFRDGGPGDVSAEALKFLALMRLAGDSGM
mgnify:CR=1 FL=1